MAISAYFGNGFEHALAGGGFALLFYHITKSGYHKHWDYWLALAMSSSALFFVPAHIGRYGFWLDRLYQFTHYPLADWDILILGIEWHRFFITHSLLIPLLALVVFLHQPVGYRVGLGLCVGQSSHLVWDAITCSLRTPVIFVNSLLEIRGYPAKGWLLVNGILLFALAVFVARKADNPAHEENPVKAQ